MTRSNVKAHNRAVAKAARKAGVYTLVMSRWDMVRGTAGMPATCAVEVIVDGVCAHHGVR